ncbi:NAD(P)H-dependent oxidoreductase [Hymenobacter sp. B81]|uniref:NAD(P)H-dependent oxidoreductase n=1 Tax=Hymenobacter sp. B81 TaxID=3344878 RepID=UPI0037DD2D68
MKKIVVINGHPSPDSFGAALAQAYCQGATASGAAVREIHIGQLQFTPNLAHGYQQRLPLEPDLLAAWETLQWADHQVWVHPVWWGGLPALTKGFIDRVFLPGLAFRYRPGSRWWDKLLRGKSARIITTLDQPGWYYRLRYGRPSVNQLRRATLKFCGVSPVGVTYIGAVRGSTEEQRAAWLRQVERAGGQLK